MIYQACYVIARARRTLSWLSCVVFFFFKQKTAYEMRISDWSSDVCSSDLNVMGWQIGNEYTDESYGPDARTAWVAWLKQRYGTLDKLNDAWTTNYWSQTYTAWDQVPFNTEKGNPGLMLEQKRFITSQWVDLQKNHIGVLRARVAPSPFIPHNIDRLRWATKIHPYAIPPAL